MTQVIDRVMKAQESSDSKFIELQEKRMKLEEKLIERLQQQDREFQMRMLAMIMQASLRMEPLVCILQVLRTSPMPLRLTSSTQLVISDHVLLYSRLLI